MASVPALAAYIGADADESTDTLTALLAQATALVAKYVGASVVPDEVLDAAIIEVAADLWNRRSAPNGIRNSQFENFGGDQGVAVRIARDPMQAAYQTLRRWVLPW